MQSVCITGAEQHTLSPSRSGYFCVLSVFADARLTHLLVVYSYKVSVCLVYPVERVFPVF